MEPQRPFLNARINRNVNVRRAECDVPAIVAVLSPTHEPLDPVIRKLRRKRKGDIRNLEPMCRTLRDAPHGDVVRVPRNTIRTEAEDEVRLCLSGKRERVAKKRSLVETPVAIRHAPDVYFRDAQKSQRPRFHITE